MIKSRLLACVDACPIETKGKEEKEMCGCGTEKEFVPRIEGMNVTGLPNVPIKVSVEEKSGERISMRLGSEEVIIYFGYAEKGSQRAFLSPSLIKALQEVEVQAMYPNGDEESWKASEDGGHLTMTFAGVPIILNTKEDREDESIIDLSIDDQERVWEIFFPDE